MNIQEQTIADVNSIFNSGLTIEITHNYNLILTPARSRVEQEQEIKDILTPARSRVEQEQESLIVFFDNPYETAFSKDEIESAMPEILIQTAAAGNINRDSSFVIEGKTYYIAENQGDNQGITTIVLSEDQT